MPLADHLRELRNRLGIAALAVIAGGIVGWNFYDQIFAFLREPFDDYQAAAAAKGSTVELTITGITSAFSLKLDVAVAVGIVLASPVWIYQLWAFVSPGLHRKERRWSAAFLVAAVPFFLGGVALGYLLVPKAIYLLLDLTPSNVANLPTVAEYFSFILRVSLAFGIAFLIPVFVVGLNFSGVLSAHRLRTWWRGAVFLVFLFTAIATPTPDPWNMILMAIPILILLLIAWLIAWFHDRRVARRRAVETPWADDEASVIDAPDTVEGATDVTDDDRR